MVLFVLCMWMLCLHVCMYHMPSWFPPRSEEDIRVPETEVMDSCALPCECWPLNPGPLQIQVLLSAEPSFQPSGAYGFRSCFVQSPPVLFSLSCVLPCLPPFHSGLFRFLFLYNIVCCLFPQPGRFISIIVRGDPL